MSGHGPTDVPLHRLSLRKPAKEKDQVYGHRDKLTPEQKLWLEAYEKEGKGSKPFMSWAQPKMEEYRPGRFLFGNPKEMATVLDYTCMRGGGSNVYLSVIYMMPKWDYKVYKVDEYIEVNPAWAEFYNITIEQKHKLEASIKQGLVSATSAVTDYELLKHDQRRYKELLEYFVKAKKSKDEHVLRSIFVDRVDAYTGEGFSMISMAKRWPTIITDFIRMSEERFKGEHLDIMKVEDIAKALDVSRAEATILRTKHQLFTQWKEMFLPTLKERVARLEVLVKAREKSIEEYRNWVKPFVTKFKAIRETSEENLSHFVNDAYQTPGFGQSQANTGVRLWAWKAFSKPERGKASEFAEYHKHGYFMVDPFDDLARFFTGVIAAAYNVTFSEKEIEKLKKKATEKDPRGLEPYPMMKGDVLYYTVFDINVILSLTKTPPPEGGESDNLMYYPILTYNVSQNILFLFIIELEARKKALENYVNELIGTKEQEKEENERLDKLLGDEEHEEKKEREWKRVVKGQDYLRDLGERLFYFFVKPGPYEPVTFERISKLYARSTGPMYNQLVDFIKKKMHVE